MHTLKPLDIAVALKIGLNEKRRRSQSDRTDSLPSISSTNSVGDLAEALLKGKGDVSRSINRLLALGLIGGRRPKASDVITANRKYYSLQRKSMSDFLCYGIRFVFGPEKKGVGRGLPTGWNCPWLDSPMNPPEIPMVWSHPGGDVLGELLEPLFSTCATACERDEELHSILSLIDVVRTGKPRELRYAQEMIKEIVEEMYS